ncbi:hypothetical protein JTB14_009087 [Gonioctena quinquepunctata]|nr:hypothetical protein JTB14_009087 [Gonioctena quinquepunctata]
MQIAWLCPFLGFLMVSVDSFMDIDMMRAYFKAKNTHRVYVVGSFQNTAKLKMLRALAFGHQTISILRLDHPNNLKILKTQNNHIGVILDGDCDGRKTEKFIKQCGKDKLFGVTHHWLIISRNKAFSDIFEDIELYINADIHFAHPKDDATNTYVIEDVFNPAFGKGGELKKRVLGYYTQNAGYPLQGQECKYRLRRNMTGVTLKSHIVLPVPFERELLDYLNTETHREINTFNRFHHSLLCPCVSYYNFTANVTLTKSWGYLTRNGTFDGLVGALARQAVDYGSSPLFVRTDRATVMEYGRRTWTLRAAFIFRNPKSKNSVDTFIKPLSWSIWLCTLFSSLFVILLLRLAHMNEKKHIDKHTDTGWSYFVIYTVGAFCQQGMTVTPFSYSGRIIIMSLLILSLMIYQFYSASLVSHLLMKPKTRIKSVEDILTSNMKVGCEDILYNRDYFLYTTDRSSKELYYNKILSKKNTSNFLPPKEGLVMVKNGQYAFHVELATAYPIIQETFPDASICELREVQMYRTQPMHANYQKNSPFRDMFDTCLQRLAELGILHRELTFWHPKKPECTQSKSITFIGLDYFYPAFMFLAIGMILSLLILTTEIYVKFKNTREIEKQIIPVYPFLK